ncbi:hypothetical protein KP509_01G026400 [Ceratopteris richardii]|nr:hypothetical protein KP509_01G026400 [Ceratopteris richardii]
MSMGVTYTGMIGIGYIGSAMSHVDTDGNFLFSPNNTFALSFFSASQETAFYLCIVHVQTGNIVWTANRDAPMSNNDQLVFSEDGNAALVHANGTAVLWSSNTKDLGVKRMLLLESGNLVLDDGTNNTRWQSFDHPTNTLLAGQVLSAGMKLTSAIASGNLSSGPFSLSLVAGDLQSYWMGSSPAQTYWSFLKDFRHAPIARGIPSYVHLDSNSLSLVSINGTVISTILWQGSAPLSRLTLQSDGNIVIDVFSSGVWSDQFVAVQDSCSLPLSCGPSGSCNADQCSCLDPLSPLNKDHIQDGCHGPSTSFCSNASTEDLHFEEVGNGALDYFANNFTTHATVSDLDSCKSLCMKNCSCTYLFFQKDSKSCYLYPQLGSIHSAGKVGHMLFIKTDQISYSSNLLAPSSSSKSSSPMVLGVSLGISILFVFVLSASVLIYWFFKVYRQPALGEADSDKSDDTLLDSISGLPVRFSYKELQTATKNFSKKLGQGGFGSVYEGTLPDKSKVAVKCLEGIGAGQGKKEFRAEVGIIGRIHHVHLVRLCGFCAEDSHRLLVYEFLGNGSLDKCLFRKEEPILDWTVRYQIALGTARGLAYLHEDCREKIIHCDIKPENILLDESYNAKVSDFGLAKLVDKEQSQVFTTMRGTRGYLAPEWIMNLAISEKSDVYSFGMVLLEIISGRRNVELSEVSEKRFFPSYAFEQAEKSRFVDLVDEKLKGGSLNKDELTRAVKVALWCIQEEISLRPSMTKVLKMLEGSQEILDPPIPSFVYNLQSNIREATYTTESSSCFSDYTNSKSIQSAVQLSEAR